MLGQTDSQLCVYFQFHIITAQCNIELFQGKWGSKALQFPLVTGRSYNPLDLRKYTITYYYHLWLLICNVCCHFQQSISARFSWLQKMSCCYVHPVCVLSVITVVCVGVGLYSENGAMPSDHSKQHMTVCGFSLHLGGWESQKTLKQKFIFQIGTINPHGINECFSFN